jgi:hypothetical protein
LVGILAIGLIPGELELACFGFLFSKIKANASVKVVIVTGDRWKRDTIEHATRSSGIIGADIDFIHNFDFSAVTQENVESLRTIVDSTNPLLVMIPNINARNEAERITSRSALLAARSIPNIMMYDASQKDSTQFVPNINFGLDNEIVEIKKKCFSLYKEPIDTSIRRSSKNKTIPSIQSRRSRVIGRNSEAFQGHRILLNDEIWLC